MHPVRMVLAAILLLLSASAAPAVEPGEMLPDPAQEQRARALSAEIRCLVCQNQHSYLKSLVITQPGISSNLLRDVKTGQFGESDHGR